MPILLELCFDKNVNIYKVSSFKVFENVIFASKSFFWQIFRLPTFNKKRSVMKDLFSDM